MGAWIPCQCCGSQYVSDSWTWYVCNTCGYRICLNCLNKHSGQWSNGGTKCSQCQTGWLQLHHGIRSSMEESRPASKLDEYLLRARSNKTEEKKSLNIQETIQIDEEDGLYRARPSKKKPSGIIFTNTSLIAKKYKKTSAEDVRGVITAFISACKKQNSYVWELVDLGAKEMQDALDKDATWMDYAQFISDYAESVGIKRSANTSLFIIGGGDIIPMPEFYANVGHDIKTIEDSDLLYCFPTNYAWKKVSIKDAIFNVARLPLDYVGNKTLVTSVEEDIGSYLNRAVKSLKKGISFTYAMMTSNAGKTNRNDWTWTSADVMSKLPQQQLENDGVLTKDNMYLCPSLDVAGEEYISNGDVAKYKKSIDNADMLFINLHGSPNKSMSGYLGAEGSSAYWGMTTELMKQLKTPIINAFPCYGARFGRYYFDNNDGSMPEYEIYDREDSMLLTSFYNSNVLLFIGSCTSSMCSNVIGSGSIADHISESENAIDLLMPAGYAEAMLKLYACYLIKGEPAGYAFLHAKIDYLNYRAKYENVDFVFLTLNQFNLFGCPTMYITPQDATHQLRESFKSIIVPPKELPEVKYKKEFDSLEQGIDGVLNRARTLVDKNLMELEERIRVQLYGPLGITQENLVRIESLEYNGQQTYTMTYSKKNTVYPEFLVIQTDNNGKIKEVLESR